MVVSKDAGASGWGGFEVQRGRGELLRVSVTQGKFCSMRGPRGIDSPRGSELS